MGRQLVCATVMTTLSRQVVAATVTRLSFVVAASVLAAPLVAEAQPGKVHRIGYLSGGPSTSNLYRGAFQQGLCELGWVEGQNIVTESRFAEGRLDRLPALAAELVRLKVDIIVASPTPAAVAAKNATGTIPIVMWGVGDPVGLGLVASLARPGGNVSGLSFSVGMDTFGKGLELLREAIPKVRRMADSVEPKQSGPHARVGQREGRSPIAGCAASVPGGPRSERVRRRLRGHGERARGGSPRDGRFRVYFPANAARRPRGEESAADDAREQRECRGRGSHVFRAEQPRCHPPCRHFRRQDPQGCPVRQPACGTTDEVRAGDQSQDREGARSDDSVITAITGGPGYRMSFTLPNKRVERARLTVDVLAPFRRRAAHARRWADNLGDS